MASRAPVDGDLAALLASQPDCLSSELGAEVGASRANWRATSTWMRGPTDRELERIPCRDELIAGVPVRWYGEKPASGADIVVYFHGGGWMLGDVPAYDPDVRLLADRLGCAVISVDYRRAPEHPFPAALDDCLAVVRAVEARHPRALAVAGDSAGGNLACAVARVIPDAVACVLALYPALDPGAEQNHSYRENAEGYPLTAAAMRHFWAHYAAGAESDPRVAVGRGELAGFPSAVIASAGYDPLRDEARDFAARLVEADVEVTYLAHPTLTHGFQQMVPRVPSAAQAVDDIYAAFALAFRRAAGRLSASREQRGIETVGDDGRGSASARTADPRT